MTNAGLTVHYVESAPNRQDAALCGARMLDGADHAATAAVCYNDSVALGLMAALAMHGIVPGRDFAVTGFDDIAEAALFTPALTTLAADPRARGRQAAQLVLQRIGSPERASQRLTAAVALNIRASSACSPSVLTHHPQAIPPLIPPPRPQAADQAIPMVSLSTQSTVPSGNKAPVNNGVALSVVTTIFSCGAFSPASTTF